MAEGEDKSQKTEEPTHKKLEDARKKGQVPSSREINHWFMIAAATLATAVFVPTAASDFTQAMAPFLERPHALGGGAAALRRVGDAFADTAVALIPLFALMVAAAVGAGLVQHGPMGSVEKLKPKLENLSLIKGFGRLFSLRSVVELIKGVLKLAIVGTVAVLMVVPELDRVIAAVDLEPAQVVALLWRLALRMLGGVSAIVALIAGIDFLYQRFEFMRSMRMSKQEVKDELKQSEGDPLIKAKLRQLRQERARRRMMAAVPEADVVITNPTHFAVALRYETAKMAAPRVVAKGADAIARRIREVAEANGVTVVENPPLARALYDTVEIDHEVPEAHYKAVAEVIGYVWRLKGKMRGRNARRKSERRGKRR